MCVHAENGTVIDAIVQEALAAGNTGPLVSRAHPTGNSGGGGRPPSSVAYQRVGGRCEGLHRACLSCEDAMQEVKAAA